MYPIKSFTVLIKTYNKVSIKQRTPILRKKKLTVPLSFASPPQMMTLTRPQTFCSSKSHKYDNYHQAPSIVSSYH